MLERSPVSSDVDAVSQATHHYQIGHALRQIPDKRVAETQAILRCMTCPHDAYHMGTLQVTLSQRIDHCRSIRCFQQATGVRAIGEIGSADAMLTYKSLLFHCLLQATTAINVAVNLAAAVSERPQFLLAHVKEPLFRAHDIEQPTSQIHTHALHASKSDMVNERCQSTGIHGVSKYLAMRAANSSPRLMRPSSMHTMVTTALTTNAPSSFLKTS